MTPDHTELLSRVHCILKHCDHTERDGLANSLDKLNMIREDARMLEDLLIEEKTEREVYL